MRGSIRKWMVLGAVASASLLVTGCEDRGQGVEVPGGPDDVTNQQDEQLLEVEPGSAGEPATGGAGTVEQELGTQGQGVTGGDFEEEGVTDDTFGSGPNSGGIRGPTVPVPEEQMERERPAMER